MHNRIHAHPELLSNEDIQQLGEKALQESNHWYVWYKTPYNLGLAFKNYKKNTNPYQKWQYLLKAYQTLAKDDKLALEIENSFKNAFLMSDAYFTQLKKMHTSSKLFLFERTLKNFFEESKMHSTLYDKQDYLKLKPNQLSIEIIQNIGKEYLEKHGGANSWPWDLWHNNHDIARQLLNCKTKGFKERWKFLAEIYGHLPNNRGDLASHIRKLFLEAFKIDEKEFGIIYFASTQKIAAQLKDVIEGEKCFFTLFPSANAKKIGKSSIINSGPKRIL